MLTHPYIQSTQTYIHTYVLTYIAPFFLYVKVLGALKLIDGGESDSKIIAIREDDELASVVHDVASLERAKPGKHLYMYIFYIHAFTY